MFYAFILVCAANLNMEVDTTNCASFEDTWGPYNTETNCKIRANQMVSESKQDDIIFLFSSILGFPPSIYVQGYCSSPTDEPA
jgi:hypothetical protein